jgi:ribonuclease HI
VLNIDACYFYEIHEVKPLQEVGIFLENLMSPTMAEAHALHKGLKLIENLGYSPVTIESDSVELVQAYNGVIDTSSPYTAILDECFQVAQRFGNISVQHCFRDAKVWHIR